MQRFTSTDAPMAAPISNVIVNGVGVREAALASVWWHCGYCSFSCSDHDRQAQRAHRCTDAAGRDLAPVKSAAMAGARREYNALKRFPVPPCMYCDLVSGPGDNHLCPGGSTQLQPHDAAAQAWARKGLERLATGFAKEGPNA